MDIFQLCLIGLCTCGIYQVRNLLSINIQRDEGHSLRSEVLGIYHRKPFISTLVLLFILFFIFILIIREPI
jgi:uncharacterized membrane protein